MSVNTTAVSLERMAYTISQYSMTTPEGVAYAPFVRLTESDDSGSGELSAVSVGFVVTMPDGTEHSMSLMPSAATNEGDGTGNIFVYEDDDPITHCAWSTGQTETD